MSIPCKTYLIAPLDWGLGHASRCVPIIQLLVKHNQKVIVAATGHSKQWLSLEFPDLTIVDFPGVKVEFESGQSFGLKSFLLGLKLWKGVKEDLIFMKEIVRKHKVDVVISDNRYGARTDNTRNILITHQLFLRVPFFLRRFVSRIVKEQIGRFDQCWIPDIDEENCLSGELSHKGDLPENFHYIGWLSRFRYQNIPLEKEVDVLVLISGPDPARSDFERAMRAWFEASEQKTVMICGRSNGIIEQMGNLTIYPNATTKELTNWILRSRRIICRSGYSTLMDLMTLRRSALLIPTPGQSEQEYLALLMQSQKWFHSLSHYEMKSKLESSLNEMEYIIPDISNDAEGMLKILLALES
ncbi:MAG: hypothetical protein SGI87_01730 [Flavobacteriales bacterium]|nr:hypothetical protein [Flavobacteriales bacterium]